MCSHSVAYLLLGELGYGPHHLNFSNNLGYALPFWEVIFWEKTIDNLGTQERYTFFLVQKNLVGFLKTWPPPLKNPRNATALTRSICLNFQLMEKDRFILTFQSP